MSLPDEGFYIALYTPNWISTCLLSNNRSLRIVCLCYIYICLMSISRFSLWDKVTLRLLKFYFYITDVAGWSRALDIRLSDWCCSASMVWVQFPSRDDLILTLFGLIFRRIYIYIQLTLVVSNSVDSNFRLSRIFIEVSIFVVYKYI